MERERWGRGKGRGRGGRERERERIPIASCQPLVTNHSLDSKESIVLTLAMVSHFTNSSDNSILSMSCCFHSQTNCFNFTHNLLHVASANSWWNKVRLHQNDPSWCSYTNPSEVGCFPSPFWWFVFIKGSHNLPGMGSASARSSCNSMLYYPQRISSSHSVSRTQFLPGAM